MRRFFCFYGIITRRTASAGRDDAPAKDPA